MTAAIALGSTCDNRQVKAVSHRAIGRSYAWQCVLTTANRVAATDATVLLQGESGTGKEVMARVIHEASPRKNGPFVAINCAALPEQLIESELFGYERGAFTGAQQSKIGQIERAAGGVLFLDEIATEFVRDLNAITGRAHELTGEALGKLMAHAWPGNVRELRNVLERAAILSDGLIEPAHLSLKAPPTPAATDELSAIERQRIEEVLRQTNGNKSRAARRLGISRTRLYVRLRRYGLERGA